MVRSDRNLYSKKLREANEEIAELRQKYKRMTQQILQLKDEIGSKDNNIHQEIYNRDKYMDENHNLTAQTEQKQRAVQAYEMTIKTQEEDIARLKYVISEAETEKQK